MSEPERQSYPIIFKQNEIDGVGSVPGLKRGEPGVLVDGPGQVSLYVGTNATSGGNVKVGPVAQDKGFVVLKEMYRTQLLASPYNQSYVDVMETDLSVDSTGVLDADFGEFSNGYMTTPVINVVAPTAMLVYISASSSSVIALSVSYDGNPFIVINEGDNVILNSSVTTLQLKLDVTVGKMYGFNWMRI